MSLYLIESVTLDSHVTDWCRFVIFMSVTDGSPTHQYTTFGSAVPVSSPSQSRPFSPPAQQSPVIITPTSPQKSSTSPSSPFPSPFVKGYKPVSPPIPVGKQPTAETKGTSPAGPGFKLGSPPKTSGSEAKLATQPGSPTKPTVANTGPQLMPISPTKSPMGAFPSSPKGHQRRPASPTKSVTFGPVTALDQKPEETPGAEEPRLSVSQKKSLFEQRQQQEKQEAVQQARLQQRKPMSPGNDLIAWWACYLTVCVCACVPHIADPGMIPPEVI